MSYTPENTVVLWNCSTNRVNWLNEAESEDSVSGESEHERYHVSESEQD